MNLKISTIGYFLDLQLPGTNVKEVYNASFRNTGLHLHWITGKA